MRAVSVRPAPTRAPRLSRPQPISFVSRGGACTRRGQLLAARAAEKAVGPEPPASAEDKAGEAEAAPSTDAAEPEESTAQTLVKLVQAGVEEGRDPAELEADVGEVLKSAGADAAQQEAQYKQADEQLRQLKDQYRRLQADFDNFRSRADQEKAKSGAAGKARVLEQLLPVIDNFEIAGKSIKTETEGEEKINDSYQSLYRQTVDIFRGLGLEAVPTVGEKFDPEMHDGIMREENDDVPDGEVLEEFRKGFKYREELLRPAMVKVAVSSKPAEPAAEGGEEPPKEDAKSDQA